MDAPQPTEVDHPIYDESSPRTLVSNFVLAGRIDELSGSVAALAKRLDRIDWALLELTKVVQKANGRLSRLVPTKPKKAAGRKRRARK